MPDAVHAAVWRRWLGEMTPQLQLFVDRVIVPALLERFLREQASVATAGATPTAELPKSSATV
jgi:hypothetical protein